MLSRYKLLIVEDVFLIALDIQRVLEGANAAQTVFARDFAEASAFCDRFEEFDLAIINAPLPESADMQTATRLAQAGPAIVVCTASPVDLTGTPLSAAELIIKPFSDDELLAACERAMARKQC